MESCPIKKKECRVRWKKGHIRKNLSIISKNDLQKWRHSIVIPISISRLNKIYSDIFSLSEINAV